MEVATIVKGASKAEAPMMIRIMVTLLFAGTKKKKEKRKRKKNKSKKKMKIDTVST